MKHFSTVLVFLFTRVIGEFVESVNLTAVNDSHHVETLYQEVKNEDFPSERDPAREDPNYRRRICDTIVNSGYMYLGFMGSMAQSEIEKMYEDLQHRAYADIFSLIYDEPNTKDYVYMNPYRRIVFLRDDSDDFTEYVFICLTRFWSYGEILPFYVSKEYNVAPLNTRYKPGRFLFAYAQSRPALQTPLTTLSYDYQLLAEEPATVYEDKEFNIELHFLNIRKYVNPVSSNALDPLCKLISDDNTDWDNQHYRFCVAVSTSSWYRDTLKYPQWNFVRCQYLEVSFRTALGRERAGEKRYYERMVPCYSEFKHEFQQGKNGKTYLYISRAYQTNQVLVYKLNNHDGNIYLENLSSNVAILDELNSFDFVED